MPQSQSLNGMTLGHILLGVLIKFLKEIGGFTGDFCQ